MRTGVIVLFTSFLLPPAAAAQTAPPPPPPKHEGSVEAAFVGVTGNSSSATLGLGAEFIARPNTWVFTHKLSFVRNRTEDTVTTEAFLYNPRAEKILTARVNAFGDYAYFRDEFAGVAHRNTVTGGLSFKAVADARQTLALDVGAGYLNEDRLSGDDVSSGIYALGSAYKLKLSETADLTDDFRYFGNFSHATDWRLAHIIAVTAKLVGGVSLKLSNTVRYSNFPVPGFKKTDTITSFAVVAKFKGKV
jgi:putative salt-induced outer membrane protein YdiY